MQQRERNPWKIVGLAVAIAIPALLVTGAVIGMIEEAIEGEQAISQVAIAENPLAIAAEECNRYASLADIGEPQTPGGDDAVARAEGAIGRDVGTIAGMSEENSRAPVTRAAYRECMARKGYTS